MDEQTSMSGLIAPDKLTSSIVTDVFRSILSNIPNAMEQCTFSEITGGVSVSFFDPNNKSFWIDFRKRSNRFRTKRRYLNIIEEMDNFFDGTDEVKGEYCVMSFMQAEELYRLAPLIVAVYTHRELELSGDLFDCCHRFEACSDAKDCIHPDPHLRLGCTYRGKLKRGIIFYGKNRNVD